MVRTTNHVLQSSFHIPRDLQHLIGIRFRFDLYDSTGSGVRILSGVTTDALCVTRHKPREPEEIRLKVNMERAFGERVRYLTFDLKENRWALVTSPENEDKKKRLEGCLCLMWANGTEPVIGQERVVSLLHSAGLPEEHILNVINEPFTFVRDTHGAHERFDGRMSGVEAHDTAVRLHVQMPPLLGQFPVQGLVFDRVGKWRMEVVMNETMQSIPGILSIPSLTTEKT